MRKQHFVFLIILLSASFSIWAEEPRFIINSGHTDLVSSLDYLEDGNLIFSGSLDGTIKVWNSSTRKIDYQLQVSHMPVRLLEVCQSKPYVAAVISDGLNSASLTVLNWQTGELVFRHRLAENPLFVRFSPQGNFITYGKTDWDSLVFLDTESGKPLYLIGDGFGIVSSAFISDSEKTLLTYNTSGSIQYWDLINKVRKTKIATIPNIENISFTSNGRYMTGYSGKELILIDLLKGNKIDAIETGKIEGTVLDQKNDKIVWITENSREIIIHTASVSATGFSNEDETAVRNFTAPTALLSVGGRIYTGFNSGAIYTKESYSDDIKIFSENRLLAIDDFAINETSLAITASGKMLSISSDFFINDSSDRVDPEVESIIFNTDSNASYGLSAGADSDFLLWESDSLISGGSIRKIDSKSGSIEVLANITTPLISADYNENKLLTLDRNGECRIIDYSTGEDDFQYTSYGLRSVDFIDGRNIIAGRNSTSSLPSPLLHINTRTGETVPIEDSNLLIFDLEYDELTRKLYTLGFEERNGVMRTVLKQHTGRSHDRSETILAYPGEDIDASFASDSGSSKIFTSLGYDGIKLLYWGGFTSLEGSFSIPKSLKLRGNLLASLNQDSSFAIFNPSSGAKVMDLFIFDDLSWAALLSDNKFYVSTGAEKYINVYDGNTDKSLNKSKYMIR